MTRCASALLALALVVSASPAFAGQKSSFPLQVDLTKRHAWGDVSATRATADNTAYVWCHVFTSTASGAYRLRCSGANAAGTSFDCTITSPSAAMVAAARSIIHDSYVDIFWNASNQCVSINVRKGSIIALGAP